MTNLDAMNEKTRNQTLTDYLECLELEYLMCILRSKFYLSDKDKRFYLKTAKLKESKINDIAKKADVRSTIFTDLQFRQNLLQTITGQGGFPEFIYRNENSRKELSRKDFRYYYQEGAEVSVLLGEAHSSLGVVVSSNQQSMTVSVKLRGESRAAIYTTSHVTRLI